MATVTDRVVIKGKSFVRLEGRHPALWWEEKRGYGRYTDGESWDTQELPAIKKKRQELMAQHKAMVKRYQKELAELEDEIATLEQLRKIRERGSHMSGSLYPGIPD